MSAIHLVKKNDPNLPPIKPVKEIGDGVFSSGDWFLSEARATSLIGGKIFFHRTQKKPSFFGGIVTKVERSPAPDRFVFYFTYDPQCRGVSTSNDGWAMTMKYVP
jgi:hypothetical protein